MGENPMLSDPNLKKVKATLTNLDLLVVSDLFLTETAALADVVFPAASFAEKTGTFTNSERRVQMVRQAIAPLGSCRSDGEIIIALSQAMGYTMSYESMAEVMEEISLLAPIYGGMFHDRIERCWGLQWPCWNRNHDGTSFLHKYYFTRGRGHFVPATHETPAELPDAEYPFILNTGRVYHQYHTGTMTRQSSSLNREASEALLEVNPQDAARLGLRTGDWVELSSKRGSTTVKAEITEQVAKGSVYTSFHFPTVAINLLTSDARDPKAQCPEYKVCAVRLEKINP